MGSLVVTAVGAVAGIAGALVTAYFTARHQAVRELQRWRNDFTLRYAELAGTDRQRAQALARQFAIGVLIVEGGPGGREKVFVPPNCRLIAGRDATNEVVIADVRLSRQHVAFSSDDTMVYVEDLGSANGSFLRHAGENQFHRVDGPTRMRTGDILGFGGDMAIEFTSLT